MPHTRLSVNINKFATLRNARGANNPDIIKTAMDCERFGAEGITVHPRPDERHIKYADVLELKKVVTTEFNMEGYPAKDFMNLVLKVQPAQCTLVPDSPDALTSNNGWDTLKHKSLLTDVVAQLHDKNIRVSLFINPIEQFIEGAKAVNAERIELYTGSYAHNFAHHKQNAVAPFVLAADYALSIGLGVNAGHDLDINNLSFLRKNIPSLAEVSIGHALVCDALYYGLENAIQMYRRQLS